MVEFSHYLLRALRQQPLKREYWAHSLSIIMKRLNDLERAYNLPLSDWYQKDNSTGTEYGDPEVSRFPHMRIIWSGSPEKSYLRDRIDLLRAHIGVPAFEWTYTPSKEDYENATNKCGIDARQLLEILQAIGRFVGSSGSYYATLLIYNETDGNGYNTKYGLGYRDSMLCDRSVQKAKAKTVTKSKSSYDRLINKSHTLGSQEYQLVESGTWDAAAGVFQSGSPGSMSLYKVYGVVDINKVDGEIEEIVSNSEGTMIQEVIHVLDTNSPYGGSSTPIADSMDWVEKEGINNILFFGGTGGTVVTGGAGEATIKDTKRGTIRINGTNAESYVELISSNNNLSIDRVGFVINEPDPIRHTVISGGFVTAYEYEDKTEYINTRPEWDSKSEVVTRAGTYYLKTSDQMPQTIQEAYSIGEDLDEVSQHKRYIWCISSTNYSDDLENLTVGFEDRLNHLGDEIDYIFVEPNHRSNYPYPLNTKFLYGTDGHDNDPYCDYVNSDSYQEWLDSRTHGSFTLFHSGDWWQHNIWASIGIDNAYGRNDFFARPYISSGTQLLVWLRPYIPTGWYQSLIDDGTEFTGPDGRI